MAKTLRRFAHRIRVSLALWHHKRQMRQKIEGKTYEYQEYLTIQLRRTLLKRNAVLKMRTRLLVDKLSEFVDFKQCNVLCIGSRDVIEVNYIRSKGAKSVVGIDLYSTDESIYVMDMHNMTFSDNSFDIVYSSHSLEHSYNIQQVVNEIIRVARPNAYIAIEMPVQFEPRGADLVNIKNTQALYALFKPHTLQALWNEEQQPYTARNNSGTSILRGIFTLDKN